MIDNPQSYQDPVIGTYNCYFIFENKIFPHVIK